MGYEGKYGTVTTEHGEIPADEPVFLLRAQDKTADALLTCYRLLCEMAGSPQRHIDLVEEVRARFTAWQDAHPGQVRAPSSERSLEWAGGSDDV